MFTLVVLGSLAAVVLGGLRSIPIAFAGGLAARAIVQNLVAGYGDDILPKFLNDLSGLRSSVPFILIDRAAALHRPRPRPPGGLGRRRRPAARPPRRAAAWRRRLPWAILTVDPRRVLAAVDRRRRGCRPTPTTRRVIALGLAMAIIFLSFVVVTGMGGMVSLAQATFVTAGGFAAGWALTHDWGVDIPALAAHGQINFLWAVRHRRARRGRARRAASRSRCDALGGVTSRWARSRARSSSRSSRSRPRPSVNGQIGWTIRCPTLDIPGLNEVIDSSCTVERADTKPKLDFSQLPQQILLLLAVFGVVTLVIHALQRSASGRAMLAVRSSEVAARGARASRQPDRRS